MLTAQELQGFVRDSGKRGPEVGEEAAEGFAEGRR